MFGIVLELGGVGIWYIECLIWGLGEGILHCCEGGAREGC